MRKTRMALPVEVRSSKLAGYSVCEFFLRERPGFRQCDEAGDRLPGCLAVRDKLPYVPIGQCDFQAGNGSTGFDARHCLSPQLVAGLDCAAKINVTNRAAGTARRG